MLKFPSSSHTSRHSLRLVARSAIHPDLVLNPDSVAEVVLFKLNIYRGEGTSLVPFHVCPIQ